MMKVSELTNEDLAKELDNVLVNDELQAFADVDRQQEAVCEAAKRLRRKEMASDSETVAEIVEMLRRFATGDERPTDEIPSFTHLADRIEVANKREVAELRGTLDLAEKQRSEYKRLYEIAKTAIREVQDRMHHDGMTAGILNQYWDILESGFYGNYRNDYEETTI